MTWMKENDGDKADGVLAKYLISKDLPDVATLTIKRLAKYMKKELGIECEKARLMDPFWLQARTILKTAFAGHKLHVAGEVYHVKRVEAYPDYEILFEKEGVDNNGTH